MVRMFGKVIRNYAVTFLPQKTYKTFTSVYKCTHMHICMYVYTHMRIKLSEYFLSGLKMITPRLKNSIAKTPKPNKRSLLLCCWSGLPKGLKTHYRLLQLSLIFSQK